jgi:hypothetical protein
METNTRIAGMCLTGFWDDHSTPAKSGLAGAEMVKPNSSTTVTAAINSIERFIDLDLLHSLDVCSSPADRLADPKEAHRTAQARSCLNELPKVGTPPQLLWNLYSIL